MVHLCNALVLMASLVGSSRAMTVNVKNLCATVIQLYDNVAEAPLAPGAQASRQFNPGAHGMIRAGLNPQATLAEFSADGGFHWFDISIIPTGNGVGPGYCPSLDECKRITGGVGFNMPMQITPLSNTDGARCRQLTCMADGCADAYQYPKDDTKTHCCPFGTDFEVTFCPGGNPNANVMADVVAKAPTPAPTPTPTPTPEPTPEPTTAAPNTTAPSVNTTDLDVNHTSSSSSGSLTVEPTPSPTPQADVVESTVSEDLVHQQQAIGDANAANKDKVKSNNDSVEATTKSSGAGSTVGIVVMFVFVFAACAAMAAIFVIRSRKRALDELEAKTPVSPNHQRYTYRVSL